MVCNHAVFHNSYLLLAHKDSKNLENSLHDLVEKKKNNTFVHSLCEFRDKKTDMKYRKILFAALLGAILTACHSTQKQDDTHTDTTATLADSLDALKMVAGATLQVRTGLHRHSALPAWQCGGRIYPSVLG
jgi:hypothetical protein